MILRTGSLVLLFVLMAVLAMSQQKVEKQSDDDAAFLFGLEYAYDFAGGDMKARYGNNLDVGAKLSYLFKNTSFQLGLKANYLFGDTVKQDVLAHLRDGNGYILGVNGTYGQVKMRERGFQIGAFASNVFSFGKLNTRSGIRVDLGVDILQHWIRLQDDNNTVAQFDDPYDKGYDRLTNGFGLNEFIGFQYMSSNRRVNYYIGFDFSQAWTESRRDFDFATQSSLEGQRLDLLFGIKAGWILPVYRESQPEELFY